MENKKNKISEPGDLCLNPQQRKADSSGISRPLTNFQALRNKIKNFETQSGKKWIVVKKSFCVFLGLLFFSGTAFADLASWYSVEACKFNKNPACPTASGRSLYELEKEKKYFCASWVYPLGTNLKVTNVANGKSIKVTVLDRGPAKRLGRSIDLSRPAFSKIGDTKKGLIEVQITEVRHE